MPQPTDTRTPEHTESNRIRWAVLRAASAVWAGFIFTASSLPGSQIPGRFGPIAHFAEYAVFAFLLALSLRPGRDVVGAALLGISIACAYAATDELHQAFVVMRTPDIVDWLVDGCGAIVGAVATAAISRPLIGRPTTDRSPSGGS